MAPKKRIKMSKKFPFDVPQTSAVKCHKTYARKCRVNKAGNISLKGHSIWHRQELAFVYAKYMTVK